MKIDWKRKLASRKFWAALIAFATALLVAFGVPDLTIEQVIAVITACGSLVGYMIGEGSAGVNNKTDKANENITNIDSIDTSSSEEE